MSPSFLRAACRLAFVRRPRMQLRCVRYVETQLLKMNKLLFQICPKIVRYIQNKKKDEKTVARHTVLLYHG